jgi:hypothetical protein
MNLRILVALCLLWASCDASQNLTQLGDAPFGGEFSRTEKILTENEGVKLIEVSNFLVNTNVYFKATENRQFLFNYSATDSNERLAKTQWGCNGACVVFYFDSSNRFKAKTRLLAYKMTNGEATELLDDKNTPIQGFELIGNRLNITEKSGNIQIVEF